MFAMLRFIFNRRRRGPDWSTMPADILESISDRLPLDDFVRFRSVCKQWRSSPSGRSELISFSKGEPWLVLYKLEKKKARTLECYIYSQSQPQCCTFKLPDLEGAVVVESKFDWLLAHHGQFFFLYNPFTFSRINLPKLSVSGDYACTFAYLPTRRECTVIVIYRVNESSLELSKCHVGDQEWATQTICDISSNQIGRRMRVWTCNHTHVDLCSNACPSPAPKIRNSAVFIYDPEKKNKMWYRFLTKGKVFVYNYPKRDSKSEANNRRYDEMRSKLEGVRSKHGKEWWQRSGGRAISVNFENRRQGTLVVDSPHDAFDGRNELDAVKASFLEPKSREM
ncbi:uncharacterized protein A4U43_C10F960 [Asparagus officinalis]|uniref:F-box domain-containing protein n=1 Tax=Asparagus officinalis TaxID=4686 RepID=A0A5P1E2W8_ASPOF|nr:uncharacterized protein LOC109825995 [Asparagus officinalis]ONK55785.1 uncharacterized protein A4U43_C10F960 [Asparagus officinalis]